jgi:beta-lactamase class A
MDALDPDLVSRELQAALERVVGSSPDVLWSIAILHDGHPVAEVDPDRVLATASMGKVFLLLDVARALLRGEIAPEDRLAPTADDAVADSGLWQHLAEPSMSVISLCVLVASVSDNLATNVLLRSRGLASVQAVSRELGYDRTLLLDRIRDQRMSADPPAPSHGSAGDLADLMHRIVQGAALGEADVLVADWLALNTDLSMVAAAFALDPLAHGPSAAASWLMSKTGADAGVRADAGCLVTESGTWSYAALANARRPDVQGDDELMRSMHEIGDALRVAVIAST